MYRKIFIGFRSFLILVFLLGLQACNNNETGKIKINSGWKFKKLLDSEVVDESFIKNDFQDTSWKDVSLPHTANIEPLVVNNQWQGICWYRKTFSVPEFKETKKIIFELEAAMNHSKIWVNETLVKVHQGGYLPVVVDLTKYLRKGKENVIAIRLDNRDNPITGPKPLKRLDFNMYGGLYRNASLTIKDAVHITHPILANKVAGGGVFVTYPKVSKEKSLVKIKTQIANDGKTQGNIVLENALFFKGKLVAKEKSAKVNLEEGKDLELIAEISVNKTNLWSPKNPNLYELVTTVFVDEKEVDKLVNKIGIREFTFQGNDLFINGEKTFLRGVNRHQEYPFVGYALSDNAQYRDAKKIKDGGFDYIRLSHYPQSPAFMDACDELGIVVIDAIMGWQYYLDNDLFREYCYTSATELIRRDRNRPSVLAWEVSLNETQMPVFFMEELDKIVHAEYPGDNVYSCGWMDDVYDIYLQARQHRIMHPHALKENQPYSVSEYGDWEYYSKNAGLNQDQLPNNLRDEYSSRQARAYGEERLLRQAYNVQESHNDNFNTKAYSDSYWVMYDYNRGYHDELEESGLMDIFRLPKFGYYFYKSQKDVEDEIVLSIASYWNEKSPLELKVFSNCEEVKLFLNDKLVSTQIPDRDKNSTNLVHPPFTFKMKSFQAGTLKAVGYIKGKAVAESTVHTPKKVTGLKVWVDESGKKPQAGVNDVVFVYIAAIDENGTVVPDFSEALELAIDGDLELMNVDGVKAEAGIATALVRIGDSAKKATIQVKSKAFSTRYSFIVQE
ncbi:glycoside hydrolase family 2 protein [Flavicella sediminum]|uniref:glycoside hydrolase family 2 protein n=1 Tax=Flavicella sediminum TaxID=2585141 RepID=UPI0011225374|nr:glycoside hydrolase family 2 TIM barrel-domain containing protein [Flavicella sediminum]